MALQLSKEDARRIFAGIRNKYREVADRAEGHFAYPTGRAGLEALGYPSDILQSLPAEVTESYCGVGNPFALGELDEGQTLLDIGCGAGVDLIFAAKRVGPAGKAVGVDLVEEMLDAARKNLRASGVQNAEVLRGSGEALEFEDGTFDAVISNGVFNLMPEKETAAFEAFRVLRPGGRLMIADQVLAAPLEKDLRARIDSWFQ